MKPTLRAGVLAALALALGWTAASSVFAGSSLEGSSTDGAALFDGSGRSAGDVPAVAEGPERGLTGSAAYNSLAGHAAAHGFTANNVPPVPASVKESKNHGGAGKDGPNDPSWGELWADWYAKVWDAISIVLAPAMLLGAAAVWLSALAGLVMGGFGGAIAAFLVALAIYVGGSTAAIIGLLVATGVTTAIASGAFLLAKKIIARFKPA